MKFLVVTEVAEVGTWRHSLDVFEELKDAQVLACNQAVTTGKTVEIYTLAAIAEPVTAPVTAKVSYL